ncbi:MAG: ATP synthase F1 subunit delta [Oscillospiraceae bacterium]|nr:ATP synthase F1 subunit delta [Oscillospiraceae bacterium]
MAHVSTRYGTALYNLALKNGVLDACLDQAVLVRDAFEVPECRQILQHPHISRAEKRAFIDRAFSGALNETLYDFLLLLISKNRMAIAVDALTVFIQLGRSWRGEVEACVTSATALREEQVSALQTVLTEKLGKRVDMILHVDPSVIGGFCVAVDGHCIDRTVKKRIEDMRDSIISNYH